MEDGRIRWRDQELSNISGAPDQGIWMEMDEKRRSVCPCLSAKAQRKVDDVSKPIWRTAAPTKARAHLSRPIPSVPPLRRRPLYPLWPLSVTAHSLSHCIIHPAVAVRIIPQFPQADKHWTSLLPSILKPRQATSPCLPYPLHSLISGPNSR